MCFVSGPEVVACTYCNSCKIKYHRIGLLGACA